MINDWLSPGKVVFFFILYWVMFFITKILIRMVQEGQGGYE